MEFREHRLENGLQIVAEVNPQAHSLAVGFFVETGARDEAPAEAGLSHFLEHMMFKGTPTRSAADVNREFDEMGAHYNAFTSEENTVYYAAVLPEFQQQAVGLLGDILRPSLRGEDFDTEKQVILEEIQMYEDQPPFCADEKCKAMLFGAHPLGNSVLGTGDSVSALTVEAMRNYWTRRYGPQDIALVATGNVDFDALVKLAESVCGGWERQDGGRTVVKAEAQPGFACVHKPSATQEYLLQMAPAPAAEDTDRYAAKLLTTILGDDTGSRLYWELVDPGLAEHASVAHYDYQGTGLYMTYVSCAPQDAAQNLERLGDTLADLEAHGITDEELALAKNKVSSRVVLSGERPRGRLFTVGTNWTQRQEYRSVRDDLDAVAALTRDDLMAVLAKFPFSKSATLAIGPLADLVPQG